MVEVAVSAVMGICHQFVTIFNTLGPYLEMQYKIV